MYSLPSYCSLVFLPLAILSIFTYLISHFLSNQSPITVSPHYHLLPSTDALHTLGCSISCYPRAPTPTLCKCPPYFSSGSYSLLCCFPVWTTSSSCPDSVLEHPFPTMQKPNTVQHSLLGPILLSLHPIQALTRNS